MEVIKNAHNNYSYLKLIVTEKSGSISTANNTSVVDYKLYLCPKGGWGNNGYGAPVEVWIDNVSIFKKKVPFDLRKGNQLLASGSKTITHNSDGSKTINVWGRIDTGIAEGRIDVSGDMKLTTIARASSVSSISGTTLGSQTTVKLNIKSSSFTHDVWYQFAGGSWVLVASNTKSSTINFTVPLSSASQIPNTTSGKMQISVRTKNNGSQVGSDYYSSSTTMYLPESVKPSLQSITLTDLNSKVNNIMPKWNYLKLLSNIKVTYNGVSGSYGSKITGYEARIEQYKSSHTTYSNGGTFGHMNFHGTVKVRAWVKDSRGRWSTEQAINITVHDYTPPSFVFWGQRDSNNSLKIQVCLNGKISPINVGGSNKNKIQLHYKHRLTTTNSWSYDHGETITNTTHLHNVYKRYNNNFSKDNSYKLRIEFGDIFTTIATEYQIGTEFVLMSKTPTGIGIGKIREHGTLDVAGSAYFDEVFIKGKKPITDVSNKADKHHSHSVGDVVGLQGELGLLYYQDTRNENLPPSSYKSNKTRWREFKTTKAMGLPSSWGAYCLVDTLNPWRDSSGGNPTQIAYSLYGSENKIAKRNIKSSSSWGEWMELVTASYTWQQPTLLNGWHNYGGDFQRFECTKDDSGTVNLRGNLKNSNSNFTGEIARLPSSVAPPNAQYFHVIHGNYAVGSICIQGNGKITTRGAINGSWLCLDGITYKI